MSFPRGSDGKESACEAGDLGSAPGLERSPGREWLPTAIFLPGESHGQRSLAGYRLWGPKESEVAMRLALSCFHFQASYRQPLKSMYETAVFHNFTSHSLVSAIAHRELSWMSALGRGLSYPEVYQYLLIFFSPTSPASAIPIMSLCLSLRFLPSLRPGFFFGYPSLMNE